MPSPSQRLNLGPWEQGLTLVPTEERDVGSPAAIEKLVNLDVTDDGFLRSRAGCQMINGTRTGPVDMYAPSSRRCVTLGSIYEGGDLCAVLGVVDTTAHVTYIYLTADGYTLYYWNSVAEEISSVQQYNNVIYLCPSADGTGDTTSFGGFTIANNFFTGGIAGTANAATSVGSMPTGDKTFIFKDRLFTVTKATSTLWYSIATDPTDYTAPDGGYIIINPADDTGTYINDVVLVNEVFYVFKRDQTFLFAYDTNPTDDGIVRLINNALGGFSAATYENDVYVINTKGIYRLVNGIFIQVDIALDLAVTADLPSIIDPLSLTSPLFLHVSTNKLLVGQFDNTTALYGFNYASLNLRNGAWAGYKYTDDDLAPGVAGTPAQPADSWGFDIFSSKGLQYFCRIPVNYGPADYTLDSQHDASNPDTDRWFPPFSARFYPWNNGDASFWKKMHRFVVRGLWTVDPLIDCADTIIGVTYDDNTTSRDSATWEDTSSWEAARSQSEVKISIKQARFRNIVIEFSNTGETATGHSETEPPNVSRAVPDNEFNLVNVGLFVSTPRGDSAN